MDSRSNQARDNRRAERVFNALSRLLQSSVCDGLSTTCDVHISDRAGRELARRRLASGGINSGEIMVSEKPTASGQAPVAGEIEVGTSDLDFSNAKAGVE